MKISLQNAFSFEEYGIKLPLAILGGLLAVCFLQFIFLFFLGIKGVFLFFMIGFTLFSVYSFKLIVFTFFITLFTPYFYPLHQSVMFSSVVLVSLLITYRINIREDLNNPLMKYLLLFMLMSLPSIINTPEPLLSIRDMSNLGAMVIMFCATLVGLKDRDNMLKVFYLFLFFTSLHTLYVVFLGITTGERIFGLLGVYYIDFAGLGSVITLVLFIYSRGIKKIVFGSLFLFITFGLVLTQTRNAWLSTGVAIISLIVYLIFNSKRYQIKRTTAIMFFVGIIVFGAFAYFAASSFSSNVSSRLDISSQETVIDPSDPHNIGGNSFVSRAFIWHTAVMAYLNQPIWGIGVYSFKHTSQYYYTLPKTFYELYVMGRTPHVTYLQVLTETGIVGLLFFLIFIFAIIKFIFKMLRLPKNIDEMKFTILISWCFVYVIFSMLMTESWLYGQYAAWTGVMLGLLINNNRLLTPKESN